MKRIVTTFLLSSSLTCTLVLPQEAITCTKCLRTATCIMNGAPIGTPDMCGAYDYPNYCKRVMKQEYNCTEGGTAYDYIDQIHNDKSCDTTIHTDCH